MPTDINKVRRIVDQLKADAQQDPAIRQRVVENAPKVLAQRGLNLDEVIEAHDLYDCPFLSMSGVVEPPE
jgi:hypothetical protein